jgi:hypothetical protein
MAVRLAKIGTHVILWKKVERADAAEAGGEDDSPPASSRAASVVFNRDQAMAPSCPAESRASAPVADALTFEGWRPWPARCLLPP